MTCCRRSFLQGSAGCAAHLLAVLSTTPAFARRGFAARQRGEVVRTEPFGRLEKLGDGVWALVSTPLQSRTTLSNGGIIAGDEGVLLVEGFASAEGARWMAGAAVELTGRRPTHVVLTHYHGDHSNGLVGYRSGGATPLIFHTRKTRELLQDAARRRGSQDSPDSPLAMLSPDEGLLTERETVVVSLGGRTAQVRTWAGHTPSDLTVTVEDPRVVFCGDLVWNQMFPNYVDAIPSRLWEACRRILANQRATYVPGHGPLADWVEMRSYLALLESVGEAARAAYERGVPAADAAAEYQVPEALGEWFMFSPRYHEVAFSAWHRELSGAAHRG